MTGTQFSTLPKNIPDDLDDPTSLFDNQHGHAVYWSGVPEITTFRGK